MCRVPNSAIPSSSLVIRKARRPWGFGQRARKRSVATTMAARLDFMSAAPRPNRWPSRMVGSNGGGLPMRQVARRHHVGMAREGQVRRPGAELRQEIFDIPGVQTGDREAEALQPVRQKLLAAGVVGRHGGPLDQRLGELQHGVHGKVGRRVARRLARILHRAAQRATERTLTSHAINPFFEPGPSCAHVVARSGQWPCGWCGIAPRRLRCCG